MHQQYRSKEEEREEAIRREKEAKFLKSQMDRRGLTKQGRKIQQMDADIQAAMVHEAREIEERAMGS